MAQEIGRSDIPPFLSKNRFEKLGKANITRTQWRLGGFDVNAADALICAKTIDENLTATEEGSRFNDNQKNPRLPRQPGVNQNN